MNQLSVLKLFKGYIGDKTDRIRKEALKYGLLIPESASDEVCAQAIELYGKDGRKWNQTFHKSWNKVASAPIEELVYEQLIHYMTTYGFEELGIFSHEAVYIPRERLEIPDLEEDIELLSIRAYTKEEVAEKLMVLLTSGIALSKNTISCLTDLAELIDISRFEEIRNREARIALCDVFAIAPKDPDEFLRYVIYKASGNTLKIQDPQTLGHLKLCSRKELLELFQRYLSEDADAAMKKLASVFFRNKKLFLAMKTSVKDLSSPAAILLRQFRNRPDETEEIRQLNHLINRIRKLADRYHHPLPSNKLDRLTSPATRITEDDLRKALDAITVFREVRILNGLSYCLSGNDSIVYKIRNGKSFATEKDQLDQQEYALIDRRRQIVHEHLISRLKPSLAGKTIRLPRECSYKVPASEKQFVGNFPCGTSFAIGRDSDLIFGIHWTNLESDDIDPRNENGRVDLDLHLQNLEVSYGWNSAYRSDQSDILFSGDLTDAPLPLGASELYYIGRDVESCFMFSINNYTSNGNKIPFEIVLARSDKISDDFEGHHLIDPNDILLKIPMEVPADENLMRLGFVYVTDEMTRIVFDSFSSGKMIISRNDDPVFRHTFHYVQAVQSSSLALSDLLKECGAVITEDASAEKVDCDLSLDALTRDSLIALLNE